MLDDFIIIFDIYGCLGNWVKWLVNVMLGIRVCVVVFVVLWSSELRYFLFFFFILNLVYYFYNFVRCWYCGFDLELDDMVYFVLLKEGKVFGLYYIIFVGVFRGLVNYW